MRSSAPLIFLTLVLTACPTAAQSTSSIGIGIHGEGGWSNSGVQVQASRTHEISGIGFVRGEVYTGFSKLYSSFPNDADQESLYRKTLSVGIGLQKETASPGPRIYMYVVPSLTYVAVRGPGAIHVGLGGGVGFKRPAEEDGWFAELSWRGHGDPTRSDFPFDDTALLAITIGIVR